MSTLSFPGHWEQTGDLPEATIETPLGILRMYAQVNGEILDTNQAKVFALSGSDVRPYTWSTPLATVELLICSVQEETYDILGCSAAL